jgi:hypothetical protein
LDDDYVWNNESEIFDEVIEENWSAIMNILNPIFKLNDIDSDYVSIIFNNISKFFNNKSLIDKSPIHYFDLKMTGFDIDESVFIIQLQSENELNKNEIDEFIKFLDSECSDGVGEEIDEIDLSDELDEERMVYLKMWSNKNQIKLIA